jgi:single-stranded DNA-binding protein
MLKKNDRKEKDSHPDYRGVINIEGVDYWLSGWIKTGKEGSKMEGQKFFSLAVQPMDDQRGGGGDRGGYSRGNDRGNDRGGYSRGNDSRGRADDRGRNDSRSNDRGHSGSGFDDMDDDIPF